DWFRRRIRADPRRWVLRKGNAAARGVVITEGRNPAIIGGAQLLDGNVSHRLEDSVANFLRSFDAGVDGIDHADENPLIRFHIIPDDFQSTSAILFARQCNVEIPRLQLEQARQQFGVIDIRAVGRVAVPASAGMYANALAVLRGESRQRKIVQIDKTVEKTPRGSSLIASRPSVKSI